VTSTTLGTSFAVPGEPVGALDAGQPTGVPSLRALGLRGQLPASGVDELFRN
jgi:hypothetical protein